jgi:carboxymethylenebutenolidase
MSDPKKIEVKTPDGVAPCYVTRPEGDAKLPGVIMFPDAGTVRPDSHAMAKRVASWGYVVLEPHIFYREGDYAPFDMKTVWGDAPERDRIMKMLGNLDDASAMRDAGAYIDALFAEPHVAGDKVATMGYCIGGKIAFLTAGHHASKVAAAAPIHAGGLVTDGDDSPHLQASKIDARLYLGIADDDGSCSPAHQAKLIEALASNHVRFTIDFFKGRKHGFAMTDFAVYDERAATMHYHRTKELFEAAFDK